MKIKSILVGGLFFISSLANAGFMTGAIVGALLTEDGQHPKQQSMVISTTDKTVICGNTGGQFTEPTATGCLYYPTGFTPSGINGTYEQYVTYLTQVKNPIVTSKIFIYNESGHLRSVIIAYKEK